MGEGSLQFLPVGLDPESKAAGSGRERRSFPLGLGGSPSGNIWKNSVVPLEKLAPTMKAKNQSLQSRVVQGSGSPGLPTLSAMLLCATARRGYT